MREIAFCVVIENKAHCLDEWLAYHYLIGVEHFYIMDDYSRDNVQEVLHKWIKKGVLTYIKLDEFLKTNPARQVISYITYCDILKNSWQYLGFLDVDEFFVPPNGNIKEFLKTIPEEATACARIINPRNIAIDIKASAHFFKPAENSFITKEHNASNEEKDFISELKNEFSGDSDLSYLHGEELILSAKKLPPPSEKATQYIVSITSHGKNLHQTAPVAIAFILHGNILPDRIILWVSEEGWQENKYLRILQEKGLEIRYCEDFLTEDNCIITAGDNLFYPDTWLEQLIEYHKTHPNKIICHSALGIRVDCEYNPLPYDSWDLYIETQGQERIFASS